MSQVIKTLIVEDNPADARLIRELLSDADRGSFVFSIAASLAEAFELLAAEAFDVALVDLSLPDSQGLTTVSQIVAAAPALPVVVVTGLEDESLAVEALTMGAQDYLFKGEGSGAVIGRTLRYARERKRTSERLAYLAYYDQLTGLANRFHFQERLADAITRARRSGTRVGIFFLDLDRFKEVNDVLGHSSGDRLLVILSRRLEKCVRAEDLVARLGGDEFTIIVESLSEPETVRLVAEKLETTFRQEVKLGTTPYLPTASIGIALFPDHGDSLDELLRAADSALYQSKARGRDQYCVFDAEARSSTDLRGQYLAELEAATRDHSFSLAYQPQVDVASLRPITMEAKLCWRDLESDRLIADLHDFGLIVTAGEWALRRACADCRSWRDQGIVHARVAVNISLRQLKQRNFFKLVESACSEAGLPPTALDLEVKEEVFLEDNLDCLKALRQCRKLGVRICLDDFGSGYVNLCELASQPIDAVKIAPQFLEATGGDGANHRMFDAIVFLCRTMDVSIVVMGIDHSKLEIVRQLEGVAVQGFGNADMLPLSAALECWSVGARPVVTRKT